MKKVSRATKLLKQIKKTPLKYGEMQKFVWELNGRPKGYETKFLGNGKTKTYELEMSRGYWSTNIATLIFNQVIAKNPKTKTYHITEIGKLNIDKPFTRKDRQKLSLTAKLFRAEERVKVLEHNLDFLSKRYNEQQQQRVDNLVGNKIAVEIREYVNMVTRGIH